MLKEKIEINQADMLGHFVEKINFLMGEYNELRKSFKSEKGKLTTDALVYTESYERFLKEKGDIERLIHLYELFVDEKGKPEKK